MTCIAATRNAIAGERQSVTEDGIKFIGDTKIWRFGDALYGCSGDSEDGTRFRAWIESGSVGPAPEHDDPDSFNALRVDKDGIWFCGKSIWDKVNEPVFAIGSGAPYALGSLFNQDDNLILAISAACKWVDGCGGPIDVLEL